MNVSFPKPLTEKEEKYYIAEYENGNEEAKQILIERNLRLVAHIAKKYTSNSHIFDDYVSIGTIGLIKAVNSYSSDNKSYSAVFPIQEIDNLLHVSGTSSDKCHIRCWKTFKAFGRQSANSFNIIQMKFSCIF